MKKFLSDVLINCDLTVSGSTSLGAATGVTVATSDNSNKIATTAWVKSLGFSTANTTYLLDVPANTTNFRLIGSDSSTDTITLSAAGASSITRVSASELRITSTDSVDYVSNVSLNGNNLDFTAVGSGFVGSIDLSTIASGFNATDVRTVYERVRNVSGALLLKGTPLAVVPGQTSGNVSDVVPADASDPTLMPAVFILNEDLNNEIEGEAVAFGNITGIDTSLYDSGTTVYVAPGGGWTADKPQGANLIQNLGIITKSHSSNGGGVVMGAGRSNDVPNILQGYAWVGNANGVATPTLLGSLAYSSDTYVKNVLGDSQTISTSYDTNTDVVTVTPILSTSIVENGTGLVDSHTVWRHLDINLLNIAPVQNVLGDGLAFSSSRDSDTGVVTISGIFNNEPAQNSEALVTSGGIWSYIDGLSYDNYGSWNLKTNGVQRTTVQSGGNLDIVAGTNVAVSYGAGGVVTISSTDTNTDTNNYLTGLSFNTTNGILTATRQGLGDLTVDLDGRYLTSYTETDTLDSVTDRGNSTTNSIIVGSVQLPTTHSKAKIKLHGSGNDAHSIGTDTYQNTYGPSTWDLGTIAHTFYGSQNNILAQFGVGGTTQNSTSYISGDLGIGTASPENKLSLGSTQNGGIDFLYDSANTYKNQIKNYWNSSADTRMDFNIGRTANVAPVTVMSVGYNSNVGIGTTSPAGRLELNGSGQSWSTAPAIRMWDSFNSKGWLVGNVNNITAGDFYIRTLPGEDTNPGTSNNEFTIKHATGNVGIGTTSPGEKLHVLSSGNTVARFETSLTSDMAIELKNSQGSMFFGLGGGEEFAVGTDADLNGTNSKFVVKSSGNVGIGTTGPGEKLDVSGNIRTSGYLIVNGDDAVRIAAGNGTGNPVPQEVASFGSAVHIGAFIDFTIYNEDKSSMRSGTLQLAFNADQVVFNEVSTMDIGDTTPCILNAVNNAGVVSVTFESPDPTFHIKYQVRTI